MQMSPQKWGQNCPLGALLGEPGCWKAAVDINFPQPSNPQGGPDTAGTGLGPRATSERQGCPPKAQVWSAVILARVYARAV